MPNNIRLRSTLPLAAFVFVAASVGGCERRIDERDIVRIPLAEVASKVETSQRRPSSKAVLLIDPRSPERYARGHVPGARNVGLQDIPDGSPRPAEIEGYDLLIVYGDGRNDPLARAMVKRLLGTGLKKKRVRMLEGGLQAWTAAGNPLDSAQGG